MKNDRLSPIDIDSSLKYRCTNIDCSQEHWISLREAKTKNFKIVCFCGSILIPKQIKKIKVVYKTIKQNPSLKKNKSIPQDILDKCVKVLVAYGFTSKESEDLIKQVYIQHQTDDSFFIIKQVLENIGATNA
jgi:hypothetical protein